METRLKLNPGQKGTKKLLKRYGKKLVCVRYRYDKEKGKRYKTVELIIEEVEWKTNQEKELNKIVEVQIKPKEFELRGRIKSVGGKWDCYKKVWRLPYKYVIELNLQERMVYKK
jgi:hypothetical protein